MKKTKTVKDCGVTRALGVIGRKWTMHILHALCGGTKRFGQLKTEIGVISPKTLSQRLKELEREGIVAKRVYPVIPLRVEYSLTPRGKQLRSIFDRLETWGQKV